MSTFERYITNLQIKGKISFSLEEMMSELNISTNAALCGIHRLRVKGQLVSPVRGFYVMVPPEYRFQGCIPSEQLIPLLMKHLNCDYYVSLLAGALRYGASHQKPNSTQVIVNKRLKGCMRLGEIKIEFILKKSFSNLPIEQIVVNTGYLKIASPELIIFDLFKYSRSCGGLNHIATVLSELVDSLEIDRLIRFANSCGVVSWLQRLGFILSKIETFDEEKKKSIIAAISSYLTPRLKFPIPLASELPTKGYSHKNPWLVIENTSIESDL